MSGFIFIEDVDPETGHGWRFIKHKLMLDENGFIKAYLSLDDGSDEFENYSSKFAEYSFAWICSEEYYLKNGHLEDNIRTNIIREHFPKFAGVSDMESHFEFRMTPGEMKKYLISLGMTEVRRA